MGGGTPHIFKLTLVAKDSVVQANDNVKQNSMMFEVILSDIKTRVGIPHKALSEAEGNGETPHIFKLTRWVDGLAGSGRF